MEERAWIRTKITVHRLLLGIYCHMVSGVPSSAELQHILNDF